MIVELADKLRAAHLAAAGRGVSPRPGGWQTTQDPPRELVIPPSENRAMCSAICFVSAGYRRGEFSSSPTDCVHNRLLKLRRDAQRAADDNRVLRLADQAVPQSLRIDTACAAFSTSSATTRSAGVGSDISRIINCESTSRGARRAAARRRRRYRREILFGGRCATGGASSLGRLLHRLHRHLQDRPYSPSLPPK
jgi:hypothetical protein